ncbi:Rv3235 family protein [Marinactinospora rubrisoli]|uniref:Rv3235 family protein n=1 Tax=Marinactinospora rubrisoli TaxID=2715399 RepID=A0ABW2KMB5_9ACTN
MPALRPQHSSHPATCRHAAVPATHGRARELTRFTQLVAEVLAGQRDPAQLRDHMSGSAYGALRRRAGAYAVSRCPRLRRTHLRSPAPGVTEVSCVIDCGARHRALALRIESAPRFWLCTSVETDVRHR